MRVSVNWVWILLWPGALVQTMCSRAVVPARSINLTHIMPDPRGKHHITGGHMHAHTCTTLPNPRATAYTDGNLPWPQVITCMWMLLGLQHFRGLMFLALQISTSG